MHLQLVLTFLLYEPWNADETLHPFNLGISDFLATGAQIYRLIDLILFSVITYSLALIFSRIHRQIEQFKEGTVEKHCLLQVLKQDHLLACDSLFTLSYCFGWTLLSSICFIFTGLINTTFYFFGDSASVENSDYFLFVTHVVKLILVCFPAHFVKSKVFLFNISHY